MQKSREQVPYKQFLPVQCGPEVTCQGVLGGGCPGASSISSSTFANTYLLHSEGSRQGSSDNWDQCWPGTAPEPCTCTGGQHLPSSCKNLSSLPWSRSKEGASPFTVPFCLCVDQHSQQSQEVLGWNSSLWARYCASTLILWFLLVLGCISCRNSYFLDLFNKQLSRLPRAVRNAEGRTGTAMALFFSASGCPRILLIT